VSEVARIVIVAAVVVAAASVGATFVSLLCFACDSVCKTMATI
jgi:hypothetical protein